MSDLPSPLVPAQVDLRDFAFMPLDVVRLRDSGLTAKATGDEFRAAVLLWCASWHQVPAGSLPDDDAELSNLCGYGRALKEWKKIRDGSLRGWVKCSDNRLYHPIVGDKAREAWQSKLAQRARTEAARRAREEQRQKQSQGLSQKPPASVTETVTESKGQGQGQGQGQGIEEEKAPRKRAAAPSRPDDVDPQVWSDWLALRKAKKAPVTLTVLDEAKAQAAKAGMPLEAFLRLWCRRGTTGLEAAWLKPHERPANGRAEPEWRITERERMEQAAGRYAARPAGQRPATTANPAQQEILDAADPLG